MNFKEWIVINEGSNPGSKTGLYPLGYAGIGLYPPQWYLTRSADAIYYTSIDDRLFKVKDKLNNLPGKKPTSINSGEEGQWNITHLGGGPTHTPGRDNACCPGEGPMWSIKHIRESSDAYKSIIRMISQEMDISMDNVMNMRTDDLSSEMRDKIKKLGVLKSRDDGMGGYGRIARMIDDGIEISKLVDMVGD